MKTLLVVFFRYGIRLPTVFFSRFTKYFDFPLYFASFYPYIIGCSLLEIVFFETPISSNSYRIISFVNPELWLSWK